MIALPAEEKTLRVAPRVEGLPHSDTEGVVDLRFRALVGETGWSRLPAAVSSTPSQWWPVSATLRSNDTGSFTWLTTRSGRPSLSRSPMATPRPRCLAAKYAPPRDVADPMVLATQAELLRRLAEATAE